MKITDTCLLMKLHVSSLPTDIALRPKGPGLIAKGDKVLISGGRGVGVAAIEVAKAYGAEVIAAVSSEDKAEFVNRC